MKLKGIDVSSFQDMPNWARVKQDGIQFAILRCHQRFGVDSSFEYNYKNAREQEIPVGVYKYSYAMNEAEAFTEANNVLATLNGRELQLPVYLDLEYDDQFFLGPAAVEAIALKFLSIIEKAGYKVGIYCNDEWYNKILTTRLKSYDLWISHPYHNVENLDRLRPAYCVMWQYSFKGSVRGINGNVDMDYLYKEVESTMPEVIAPAEVRAEDILKTMRGWVGLSRANGTHKPIIDIYNSQDVLLVGYRLSYDDDYCDATVSAAFIRAGNTDIIGGTECGVERHVLKFIQEGIWNEDGTITPAPGDIIVYNWDDSIQPNDGFADHIAIVEKVADGMITAIEGNMSGGVVGRRYVPVGWGYIRGYARPKYYTGSTTTQKTIDELAKEVLQGKWGNGIERVTALMDAGYDPALVQNRVNELVNGAESAKPVRLDDQPNILNRTAKFVGRVTAYRLNVRTWAGTSFERIKSYPVLANGNLVDVCDTVNDDEGNPWYYIRIASQFYGFVSAAYVERT